MELIIPEGINYECTGCGKCCSGWSVPLTQEDYERIAAIDWGKLDPNLKDKDLFRALKPNEKLNTPYTHAIKAEPSGQCPFLKNNLCFIHSQFGPETKPAICQLFPYCFNETPDGIYSTVSFISRGVIFNAGRSLIEQKEYLKTKFGQFQKLFPNHHPNWSQIKLSSNVPLSWEQYLEIEKTLLTLIQDTSKSLLARFLAGSQYLSTVLDENITGRPRTEQQTNVNLGQGQDVHSPARRSTLNPWDKVLFSTLYKIYFPRQNKAGKSWGQLHLGLSSFIKAGWSDSETDKLIAQAANLPWPENDAAISDLIYRFFYSRVFGKLYFGAGFGQLSLIAGFNHLALALGLLRLKAGSIAMARSSSIITLDDVVATIVQLEKSLGELKISPYGAAILELLLASQGRIRRFLALV